MTVAYVRAFWGKQKMVFLLLKALRSYRTTSSTVLSLIETKYFWKNNVRQALTDLQSLREIEYSIGK